MEANQKFFPVLDAAGKLSERFVGIANIESRDESEVRKGYERVIRPRFADAKFFFVEDMKQGLASMGEGLKTVKYQDKLGSVADKVARVTALAQDVAQRIGVDPALARRAAALSKNDLQSRLVNEFPELQGIAGRYYAAVEGEPLDVAAAIDEAYMPRFAADDIAPSPLGRSVAIAERLDTLAGAFAAGLKPSGNKDPFALRRNALGLVRTIIGGELDLDLPALIETALHDAQWQINAVATIEEANKKGGQRVAGPAYEDIKRDERGRLLAFGETHQRQVSAEDVQELVGFVLDRLRSYSLEQNVPVQQFEAVAALRPASLLDFDRRLRAIAQFAQLPEAQALAAANKRIRNILKKAEGELPTAIDPALFAENAERELASAVDAAIADTDPLLAQRDYVAVLGRLARLRPQVDAFFDGVMVNVDDAAVRNNRLALLKRLSDRLGSVAAIEHLSI